MTQHTTLVVLEPTLQSMAEVYALSREGGPQSPRFAAYVKLAATRWGLAPYNPMAGDAALEAVQQLLAVNAEPLALDAAQRVVHECNYPGEVTLAIAVRSKGMWTDRVATEVDERVTAKPRRAHHGVISLWSREDNTASTVVRESVAEAVRVMWHAIHGAPDTVHRAMACEGLAYALAEPLAGAGPYGGDEVPDHTVAVLEALELLDDSRNPGDVAAVLYGDEAAAQLGYAGLGLAPLAGYRVAMARARKQVADGGAARALHMNFA